MFAKVMKDAFSIARLPFPLSRRLQLLKGLGAVVSGGHRLLGWNIKHAGRPSMVLLYSEIFARQGYRFSSEKHTPVILDCGANIGIATLYFKWLFPKAQITAFEPDPHTFDLLKENILGNLLEDVVAENIALGREGGEIDFHIPEPGSLMMSAVVGRGQERTIRVPCQRLSTFIHGEIDMLKLDIEGMEEPVLEELAASNKLPFVREMVVEIHHNLPNSPSRLSRILALLENNGFQYHVVNFYSSAIFDCSAFEDVVIHARRYDG